MSPHPVRAQCTEVRKAYNEQGRSPQPQQAAHCERDQDLPGWYSGRAVHELADWRAVWLLGGHVQEVVATILCSVR